MKKLLYILPLFACLVSCDSDDDGFYNTIYVDSDNLVNIETGTTITLGEPFFVNANIPNLLDEPGFSEPLNLRRTTGNAGNFRFSYVIEKQSGSDWLPVDMTGLHAVPPDSGLGSGVAGYFVEAKAEYYTEFDAYRYRGGVTLEETGTYRFTYSYNSDRSDGVELFSSSPGNNIDVKIFSTSDQLNGDGAYIFTVN
jgi:hypothetical protein